MAAVEDFAPASSPLGGAAAMKSSAGKEAKEESLSFYKAQYEQLEAELADFQTSSKELEAELEKDVEEAEKRERMLREKNEALQFEVDEWKSKCRQAKSEANSAQNTLQKEITSLRDTNRSLQLKLRDIEVQNDDFERQARNTTSSLEDLESKHNQAIERAVMLEGEIKTAEQEREQMRIEAQRLRDELSDLKVEAEILQDKLRRAEAAPRAAPIPTQPRPISAHSDHLPVEDDMTAVSSSGVATPPTKSISSIASDKGTPPSPPTSDSGHARSTITPAHPIKSRLSITNSVTPRPLNHVPRPSRPSRTSGIATPANRRISTTRSDNVPVPSSSSLVQIRGLIGKMQRLEQRVQSARSKLPAPTSTPPRASPRPESAMSGANIPATVTMRSARKRTSASVSITGSTRESSAAPSTSGENEGSGRPSSRLSHGFGASTSTLRENYRPSSRQSITNAFSEHGASQTHMPARPASRAESSSRRDYGFVRPASRQGLSNRQSMSHLKSPSGAGAIDSLNSGVGPARPASRQSLSTRQSMSHLQSASGRASSSASSRPPSRTSMTGARTPLGGSFAAPSTERTARPRSSVGGSYAAKHSFASSGYGANPSFSSSVHGYGRVSGYGLDEEEVGDENTPSKGLGGGGGSGSGGDVSTPTPSRRTTLGKDGPTAIPMPSSSSKRASINRTSAIGVSGSKGDMGPPPERKSRATAGNIGETF